MVIRWLISWAFAAVATAALGSLIQSLYNLHRLAGIDAPTGWSDRFSLIGHDLLHFAPNFAILMAVAMIIAFPVAGWLVRIFPVWRGWLYALAGFAAMAMTLFLMANLLPVTIISAARSTPGFVLLCLAGAAGGAMHAAATRRRLAH